MVATLEPTVPSSATSSVIRQVFVPFRYGSKEKEGITVLAQETSVGGGKTQLNVKLNQADTERLSQETQLTSAPDLAGGIEDRIKGLLRDVNVTVHVSCDPDGLKPTPLIRGGDSLSPASEWSGVPTSRRFYDSGCDGELSADRELA